MIFKNAFKKTCSISSFEDVVAVYCKARSSVFQAPPQGQKRVGHALRTQQ